MIKLNQKGFTIIELVVSFALIMLVITSLLTIIMTYRERAQLEVIETTLTTYKNNLTKDIQDDIKDLGITSIVPCTEDTVACVDITFGDASTKKLLANKTSLKNKYIKYGTLIYKIIDNIPASATEAEALNIQSLVLMESNTPILQTYVGSTKTIYKISIPIKSQDLEQDFGIYIYTVK